MSDRKSVADLADEQLRGKAAFVRVDFNVPQVCAPRPARAARPLRRRRRSRRSPRSGPPPAQDKATLAITDDTRIRAALPTIQLLTGKGARVVLASHLGRPKGADPKTSLGPAAERLSQLLGQPVQLAADCVGEATKAAISALQPGHVLLLENVRWHPEEERNDGAFARELAAGCDLFVNDAFGSAHRAHASTAGVAQFLSPCAAGLLMQKELAYLGEPASLERHMGLAAAERRPPAMLCLLGNIALPCGASIVALDAPC
jgi:phosphoglycerate kinase